MRVFRFLLVFLAFAASAMAQPAPGGRRVALVIGNNAYPRNTLASPVKDSQDMASVLRAAGFTLVGGGALTDLGKREFERAILEFGRESRGADAALFYFSGHGMEWDQQNWLIPTDDPGGSAEDSPLIDVSVDTILRQITAARPRVAILILDACRGNVIHPRPDHGPGTGGLAAFPSPLNTIVAFATQPNDYSRDGGPGRNSPYTSYLLDVIRTPGLELFQVFNRAALATQQGTHGQQIPWTNYSPIQGEFYFFPARASTPATEAGGPPPLVSPPPVPPSVLPPTSPPRVPEPQSADTPSGEPDRPASAGATGSGGQDPSFTLVNLSGQTVADVRVSLGSDRNWGANRVRDHQMRQGDRLGIELPARGECAVDIRVAFRGEDRVESSLDTCDLSTLVIGRDGKVSAANPDFTLINGTGRRLRALYASLTSNRNWGQNRLRGALDPDDKLDVELPSGAGCDVDIEAVTEDGGKIERRGVDTCSLQEWTLR